VAAGDGGPTLSRLLRRLELAGHDPQAVLHEAVTSRPLDDARQLTNVIHHRIAGATTLDPIGDTYTDWTPKVDDPQWQRYRSSLAEAADTRRRELGRDVAREQPQWAVEAFGPLPEDEIDRRSWHHKAGVVAAHRELVGHDDAASALGAAPEAGARPRRTPPGARPGVRSAGQRPTATSWR